MIPGCHDLDEDVAAELRAEDRARRAFMAKLSRHPDPRDPEYPGHFEPEEGDEDETED